MVLMGGTHGDEYEGQIAIDRLAKTLRPEEITGRIICLPMLNFPAADAGLRCSPIDEGNLNRAFPADPRGTPTQLIAHYVEEVLMPLADYAIDLHSGGASLFYPPTFMRCPGWTEEEANAYFLDNGPITEAQARSEVRRYIVMPGQATGYKIGMLRIQALRRKAEAALGDAFDIRAFHDTILGGGAMPLTLLEARVDRWITETQGSDA